MSINNISGISPEELKKLMIDDPDFANILINKNKLNNANKEKQKPNNISNEGKKLTKEEEKQVAKQLIEKFIKEKQNKNISKEKPKESKEKPKESKNISKEKPEPKKIAHKTNDPNKATNDPNTEPCKDPNCNICEKPEPQKSEPKKPEPPKNISDDLSMSWRKRLAKLTYKYPKVAYVYDYYINKQNGVTADLVKENILFYEDLKGAKK